MKKHLLNYFILFFCSLFVSAQPLETQRLYSFDYLVTDKMQFYEDKDGMQTINSISAFPDDSFKVSESKIFHKGYIKSKFWFRLSVKNNSEQENYILIYDYPLIHKVHFFIKDSSSYQEKKGGIAYKFNEWSYKTRHPQLKFQLKKNETAEIYIMAESIGDVFVAPVKLYNEESYFAEILFHQLFIGFFYATLLILIIVNLFYYLNNKSKSYLYYIFYVISMGLFLASRDGIAYEYFYPGFPLLAKYSFFIFATLSIIFIIKFSQEFLSLKSRHKIKNKILNYTIYALSLLSILTFFDPLYSVSMSLVNEITTIPIVIILIALIQSLKKNELTVKYFFVAYIILIIGSLILISANFGFEITAPDDIMKLCVMLEVIIFAIGLIIFFNRTLNEVTQKSISSLQEINRMKEEANTKLELEVKNRTNELLEKTVHLEMLNNEIQTQNEEITIQRNVLEERTKKLSDTLNQLKQSQDKLIEAEKMVALGQLISGVAHEINTPLGAIRSSVGNIHSTLQQILTKLPDFFRMLTEEEKDIFFILLSNSIEKKAALSSKEERAYKRNLTHMLEEQSINASDEIADTLVDMYIYENIEPYLPLFKSKENKQILQMAYKLSGLLRSSQTINTAADRASKVVFALKSFAHYDNSGEKTKADIINGIETVLTLYYNQIKHGVTVERNYHEIPLILCYPDELNQVWTNLIHNALQAMENKGILTIDVCIKDSQLVVSITDSGKGIPEEIQDKIFNPFFTTKPQGQGSGLGLDIVRRIIDKHEGSISFTSVPGKTTFTTVLRVE